MNIKVELIKAIEKNNLNKVKEILSINKKRDNINIDYEIYYIVYIKNKNYFLFLIDNYEISDNYFEAIVKNLLNDNRINKLLYINYILKKIKNIKLFKQILDSNKVKINDINFFLISNLYEIKEYEKTDLLFNKKEIRDLIYSNEEDLYIELKKRSFSKKILLF